MCRASVTTMAQPPRSFPAWFGTARAAVLPGVTVTVTGAALVAPRTLVTDEHGR